MASVEAQVAHIWRRLGFGPAPGDVEEGVAVGPQALIEDLCARPATTEADWAWPVRTDWTEPRAYKSRLFELMAESPCPVQERVSWILTGLVVIATGDHNSYPEMKAHFNLLRDGALHSYADLLADVTPSTGMQWYLDGINSSRTAPNENLARELCELFSLGITHPVTGAPNYSETDVREIARALTGYRFNWTTNQAYFDQTKWDGGSKTFFGQDRGPAKVAEVLAAIAAHPSFRYFVPRRLYRELVGLEPDASTLEALAQAWGSGGDLRVLVTAIARRPEFLSDGAIGARVKCPVELVVGAVRVLDLDDLERFSLDWQLSEMAQDVFRAPNVSGWPSGAAWLHAGHLIQWSKTLNNLCWGDNGSADVPVARRCPTIRELFTTGSRQTGGDLALRLAGLWDVSPETQQAARDYVAAGSWTFQRACGLMNLVLASPEYLVN